MRKKIENENKKNGLKCILNIENGRRNKEGSDKKKDKTKKNLERKLKENHETDNKKEEHLRLKLKIQKQANKKSACPLLLSRL